MPGRLPGPHLGAPGGGRRGGGFRSPPQLGSPPGHPTHGCPGLETSSLAEEREQVLPDALLLCPQIPNPAAFSDSHPGPGRTPSERRALPATLGLPSPLPAGRSREVWGPAPGSAPGGGHAARPRSPRGSRPGGKPFLPSCPSPGERGDGAGGHDPLPAPSHSAGDRGARGGGWRLSRRAWPRADSPACWWVVALGSGSEGPEVRQPQRRWEPECGLETAQRSYLTSAWDSPHPPPRPPRPRVPVGSGPCLPAGRHTPLPRGLGQASHPPRVPWRRNWGRDDGRGDRPQKENSLLHPESLLCAPQPREGEPGGPGATC